MWYLIFISQILFAQNDFVDVLSPAVSSRKMDLNYYKEKLNPDQVLEVMDSENPENPETMIIYKMVDENKILLMHLFDLNQDGKIEIVKHFENDKLKRTETALDHNGQVFAITDYDIETKNPIKKVSFDQQVLTTRLYYKDELRREEVDRNLDGQVDMWIHYRDGKVIKTEVDEDFDGKNIKVIAGESTKS